MIPLPQATPRRPGGEAPALNFPNINVAGGQVWIEALLDAEGLRILAKMLPALLSLATAHERSVGVQNAVSGNDMERDNG